MKTKKTKARKTKARSAGKPRNLLSDEDLRPENIKIRVNMFMDLDVVEHFKQRAKDTGLGYQTLINQALRESVSGRKSLEQRVADLERRLAG